jgi:hypothetical protein
MHAHAARWRYNWRSYWSQHVPYHPAMGLVLPLLSLLQGAATVLSIIAIVSLLTTGSVFGFVVQVGVPVWISALPLLVAYGILVGPLKGARIACYHGLGQSRWVWPFTYFLDAVIWLAVVLALLRLAAQYFPELRNAIRSIPMVAHQAADDIRAWWTGR